MRNGGSFGNVSANWTIRRNSSDKVPVSADLGPDSGTVSFAAGQVSAVIPLNIVNDDVPEEAEPFVFKLLPDSVTGKAEVDEPMEVRLFERLIKINLMCCSYGLVFTARVTDYMLHMFCMSECFCTSRCKVQ